MKNPEGSLKYCQKTNSTVYTNRRKQPYAF